MGTNNSRNNTQIETGINYRIAIKPINEQMKAAKKAADRGDVNAAKAFDLLLAKKSFYSSVLLTNDTRKSDLNFDCMENLHLSYNRKRYNAFFDHFIVKHTR